MKIEQLEAFLAIADLRSFGDAAHSLYISQPAISARIKSLEKNLGKDLFTRDRNGVRITEAGQRLLPYAARILETVREGSEVIANVEGVQMESLKLGASLTSIMYIVPNIINRFHDNLDYVRVHVLSGHGADVAEMVLAGRVELGIGGTQQHPGISIVHEVKEELVAVASPGHPLTKSTSVSLAEVAIEPNLMSSTGSSFYSLVSWAYLQIDAVPNVVMYIDSIEAIRRLVVASAGVAFLPLTFVAPDIEKGELAQIEFVEDLRLEWRTIFTIRRGKDPTPVATVFLESI